MDAAKWLTNLKKMADGFVFEVIGACMTATFGFDICLLAAEHLVVQTISSCDLRSACLSLPYPTSWGSGACDENAHQSFPQHHYFRFPLTPKFNVEPARGWVPRAMKTLTSANVVPGHTHQH